jgi:hypothetical protein
LARAHAEASEAEQAEAVAIHFAPGINAVNSYARDELLGTARALTRIGAPQARVIRETHADHQP